MTVNQIEQAMIQKELHETEVKYDQVRDEVISISRSNAYDSIHGEGLSEENKTKENRLRSEMGELEKLIEFKKLVLKKAQNEQAF